MAEKLALLGGEKVRKHPFPPHPIIGEEEKRAVMEVLESGKLSTFIAQSGELFLGGKKIRQFEKDFTDYYSIKYAVAFNSATAALHAAVVACGVKPGEEVIVPPYTFTSTATSVLMHNALPVFVDIKPDIFCLDPAKIEAAITPRTRAIIPVHLFGHPADMDEIMAIAHKHNIKIIEDCAQAPGAIYRGRLVGGIGDCGIFSFTETKNIMTGEGGMLITDDKEIAEIARMVRNHGEVILEGQSQRTYRSDILGWNYRMTEIEAALGIVQFSKMDKLNQSRIELANYLAAKLADIDGLTPPVVYPDVKHVYYVFAFKYDETRTGIPRDTFVKALVAEGVPAGAGYVKPLYLNPIYHENKPFIYNYYGKGISYDKGICPVTERLYEKELVLTAVCRPPATNDDMDDIVKAIIKVLDNKRELAKGIK
ncbi:MAG: DegT/DnrJ/EryC1/StrS family aminotransferase [Dehalococcoidales bacterium]|nr:DegT/DnrJ/EryC1/StrS family aminotransferase [Dehalococcoidales bacterium]